MLRGVLLRVQDLRQSDREAGPGRGRDVCGAGGRGAEPPGTPPPAAPGARAQSAGAGPGDPAGAHVNTQTPVCDGHVPPWATTRSGCRMSLSLTVPSLAPQATLKRLSPALGLCRNVTQMEPRDTQPVGLLTRHLGLKGRPAVFANSLVPSTARPGATGQRSPSPAELLWPSVLVRACSRLSWANAGQATVRLTFQGAASRSPATGDTRHLLLG